MEQAAERPLVVVDAIPRGLDLGLKELWRRREVVWFLAWRDVKVRYQQTYLGAAWTVLNPVLQMVVYSVIFGRWIRVPSEGVPYPAFAYAGLVAWAFVTTSILSMGGSLVANASLIRKVYLPRLALPVSVLLTHLFDLAFSMLVLVPLLLWFRVVPGPAIALLPALVGIASALALGLGAWAASVQVWYRDAAGAIRHLIQLWLFLTPVIYPSRIVPEPWASLLAVNPMVGIVEGFRAALLGTPVPWAEIGIAAPMSGALLYFGLRRFRRAEATFADVI